MPPSSTTTFDSICRLFVEGPALEVPGATFSETLEDSWKIDMRTVPPSPTCGRTRSVRPTSLRSMVWKGLRFEALDRAGPRCTGR
jgi:hypothetical protein